MLPRGALGLRVLGVAIAVWCAAIGGGAGQDLAADTAALLAFRDAVGARLPWAPSSSSSSSPCGWRGVRCDGARVVALQLPGAKLAGRVPIGTVGNLTGLRTLSLRSNALSGEIPADIGNCGELRALYLQGNQLSGEIPEGFFSLQLLQRLDLAQNRISGGVSPEFNKLRRLATLYLQNNSLNGTLPADLDLPRLQLFNVSYNDQLTGSVPALLADEPASAFIGTGLCGDPLSPCTNPAPPSPSLPPSPPIPPPPAAPQDSKSSKLSGGAIAGVAVGAAAALLVALAVIILLCLKRRTRKEGGPAYTDEDASPVSVTVARTDKAEMKRSRSSQAAANSAKKLVFVGGEPDVPYDLETLLHASAEVVGKGWLGTTYRATLEGGAAVVAVKRLRDAPIPESEFRDKVATLAALRHENLAPLRAYFYSRGEKLLVSDFVGAGALSSLLHGGSGAVRRARLGFTSRARIALAAARGVAFIHGAGSSAHGNIKSSNVVVNHAHDGAYLTDHGLVQLLGAAMPLKRVTGYSAPELTDSRRASREADVYSFGVLLLELLTGRIPANAVPGLDGVDLPQWVRSVVQEEWTAEVFDASVADEAHAEEEMMRLLKLAIECTEQRPERRPVMAEVAARIEHIVDGAVRNADVDDSESVSS
ncbi:probable inactive receptor kinase RLK902 [Oryza brachyantha]|uniref:probable inactive receptor kinase RLK902 n=1 Tax=Oryza brachyantha TaxID=4533 RepID=UPI001ADC11CF|nr:probable inactive receptor kinase RLK902 [Oryza brachyantha]